MLSLLGVVGKGHQHHINEGRDGEHQQHGKGRGHEQLVDVFIQQRLQIIHKAGDLFAGGLALLGLVAAADGCPPDDDEQGDDHQGRHGVQQNLLRAVAGEILIEAFLFIENFNPLHLAQAGEHFQPVGTAHGERHVDDEANLDGQENQALDYLPGSDVAQTHYQEGGQDDGVAACQGGSQGIRRFFLLGSGDLC